MNGLALCAGLGGLELGISAVWPEYRTVCWVEQDAYSTACLVARMQSQEVAEAPIWDDVRTFDGRPWRGLVDLVSAGFPCQPWSQAGLRLGTADERWLWPEIARIVREVRPSIAVLENVPGLATRGGLAEVLGSLAEVGLDAEYGCCTATPVGSAQESERLFILAAAEREDLERWGAAGDLDGAQGPVTNEASRGRPNGHATVDRCPTLGAAHGQSTSRLPRGTQKTEPRDRGAGERPLRETRHTWPPARNSYDEWAEFLEYHPELCPITEPALCRGFDGIPAGLESAIRTQRLRALGDSCCPQQAEHALRRLIDQMLDRRAA